MKDEGFSFLKAYSCQAIQGDSIKMLVIKDHSKRQLIKSVCRPYGLDVPEKSGAAANARLRFLYFIKKPD